MVLACAAPAGWAVRVLPSLDDDTTCSVSEAEFLGNLYLSDYDRCWMILVEVRCS